MQITSIDPSMLTRELGDALGKYRINVPPPPRSVLLVDDEAENLETLSALLDAQYDVRTAGNAHEALRLLASGVGVDLVIADQRMPGISGVELLTRIAVDWPDTIRIALTAYDDVGPMMDAINRGSVFRFLLKPCAPEEIRAAIADGLRIKEGTQILRHFISAAIDRQDELDRAVWELARTRDHLLAAERLSTMGRAVSGILHKIRNLATLVSMLVSELQSSARYSDALAAGQEALDGFDALARILEGVREFTRIHDSKLELAPTDMGIFLRQTAAVALLHDGGKQCPIELEIDPDFATKEPGKGMGLGLAISHQLVTQMGGDIAVESSVNQGTAFRIRLPIHSTNNGVS